MANADWKQMMVPVTDARMRPPAPAPRPVNQALNEIADAARAAGVDPVVQLANTCCDTHDVTPAGFPQCRSPQEHINYVATAWQASVGTQNPDWGRVRNALEHFGMEA